MFHRSFFISFLSLFTLSNFVWVYLNSVTPYYDNAGHINLAAIYANIYKGIYPAGGITGFLQVSDYYPPLLYWLGGIVFTIVGDNYKYLQYFSVLFLPVSAFFLYFWVKEKTKNQKIAIFSSLFYILSPQIYDQARYFMLDLPLVTFIVISLYLLEKSKKFQEIRYTILFFLCVSLAQLTKWYAFIYLVVPTAVSFLEGFKDSSKKVSYLKKILLLSVMSLIIVIPWYLVNLQKILELSQIFSKPDFDDPISLYSVQNITYYLMRVINYQIVSIQFIWLIISLFLFRRFKEAKYFFLTILLAWGIFTFLGNKNLRYTMPLIPFFAFIMGYSLYVFKKKYPSLGFKIAIGLFLFSLLLFIASSFLKTDLLIAIPIKNIGPLYLINASSRDVQYGYIQNSWSPKEVVEDIYQNDKKADALVISNTKTLSVATLQIYSLLSYPFINFQDPPLDVLTQYNNEQIANDLKNYEYILLPSNIIEEENTGNKNNLVKIKDFIEGGKTREFSIEKIYQMPNQKLYLLKKDPVKNILLITINNNTLELDRNKALARVYMQFQDKEGNWTQDYMAEEQVIYKRDLGSIQTIRIDYPSNLFSMQLSSDWKYDGDKQINKSL